MTPPEIRDEIDSSLQNVHYHLENLEDADLIQPAGSGYSEKGTEMTVFAPASEAVVLFAVRETDRSRLKTALTRLLGAVGLLALASGVVRRLAQTRNVGETALGGDPDAGAGGGGDGAGGADGGDSGDVDAGALNGTSGPTEQAEDVVQTETTTPTEEAIETQTGTPADTPAQATGTVEPLGTPTQTPGPTGTPQPTPTPDPTGTPTATPRPTATPSPAPQATETPAATPTPTDSPVATQVPDTGTTVADEAVRVAGDGGLLSDPAVTFFLGGAFMLAVVGVWWYYASG